MKTTTAFGKKIYLLGKDHEGKNNWLIEGSWDCDWYWGFGYIATYTNNNSPSKARDIESLWHFNNLDDYKVNWFDAFKRTFKETPLSNDDIWKLCELMKSFYIAREYSDMIHRGGANYTTNPCQDVIKNDAEYDRINKEVIPSIMNEIYKIWEDK